MSLFARSPGCLGFTCLLTFRVTRASQPQRRSKSSNRSSQLYLWSFCRLISVLKIPDFKARKPFAPYQLRTLCTSQKTQLLSYQANPNSFAKYPGWGALASEALHRLLLSGPRLGPITPAFATHTKTGGGGSHG